MGLSVRNVFNDKEAYIRPKTAFNGQIVSVKEAKFRIFVREVSSLFIFFFTTSQEWENRNYVYISDKDWEHLDKNYKRIRKTKVEITDPCYLTQADVDHKLKNKIFRFVGILQQEVIDRINLARIEGKCINPKKAHTNTISIDAVFDEEDVVKKKVGNVLKNLGLG